MTNEVGGTMTQESKQTLPLLFSFREKVWGNGFLAEVSMDGRALLEVETIDGVEETWIKGVQPVGIAAGGASREEAFSSFRKAWLTVLFDLAAETTNFQDFHREVDEFLSSKVDAISRRWWDAVKAVRAKETKAPDLKQGSANRRVTFRVAELEPSATMNVVEAASDKEPLPPMAKVAA